MGEAKRVLWPMGVWWNGRGQARAVAYGGCGGMGEAKRVLRSIVGETNGCFRRVIISWLSSL
jgi:hypothetical protein